MASSCSIKRVGTPPTSSTCHHDLRSSIPLRTSGNICARTGSQTASSRHRIKASSPAARHGSNSLRNRGPLCPPEQEVGPMGPDQWEVVSGRLPQGAAIFPTAGCRHNLGARSRMIPDALFWYRNYGSSKCLGLCLTGELFGFPKTGHQVFLERRRKTRLPWVH
jgi:hypothetical protein